MNDQEWLRIAVWLYFPTKVIGVILASMAILFLIPVFAALLEMATRFLMICTKCLCIPPVLYFGANGLREKHQRIP